VIVSEKIFKNADTRCDDLSGSLGLPERDRQEYERLAAISKTSASSVNTFNFLNEVELSLNRNVVWFTELSVLTCGQLNSSLPASRQ